MAISILLADDHRIIREGLRAFLEHQDAMKVVAEANGGRSAVALARKHKPSVAVLDLSMPDLNGIDAARQIAAASAGTKVIILSVHSEKRFVTEALRAGAAGYVLKDCAFEELASAIRIAAAGQTYLSPAIARTVVEDYLGRSPRRRSSAFVLLTVRERQVLQLLAEGRPAKQIATDLGVSIKTVETHRANIMKKLGLRSIAELTKYAIREGLTPP
jgi:two-component system, NarL family, response regulator NreC